MNAKHFLAWHLERVVWTTMFWSTIRCPFCEVTKWDITMLADALWFMQLTHGRACHFYLRIHPFNYSVLWILQMSWYSVMDGNRDRSLNFTRKNIHVTYADYWSRANIRLCCSGVARPMRRRLSSWRWIFWITSLVTEWDPYSCTQFCHWEHSSCR